MKNKLKKKKICIFGSSGMWNLPSKKIKKKRFYKKKFTKKKGIKFTK